MINTILITRGIRCLKTILKIIDKTTTITPIIITGVDTYFSFTLDIVHDCNASNSEV